MKKKFKVDPFTNADKFISIHEIDFKNNISNYFSNLQIDIDFDDVDHKIVRKKVKKLLKILNEHWDD